MWSYLCSHNTFLIQHQFGLIKDPKFKVDLGIISLILNKKVSIVRLYLSLLSLVILFHSSSLINGILSSFDLALEPFDLTKQGTLLISKAFHHALQGLYIWVVGFLCEVIGGIEIGESVPEVLFELVD